MHRHRIIVALLQPYTSGFDVSASEISVLVDMIGSTKPRLQSRSYTRRTLTVQVEPGELALQALRPKVSDECSTNNPNSETVRLKGEMRKKK